MRRFDDWPERLDRFLAEAKEKTFAWGSFDCCIFSCDAVLAMTGVDLATDFRSKYSSELGAAKLLKQFKGVDGIAWKIAAEQNIIEIPVLMAQRGDVVIIDALLGPTLGVIGVHGTKAVFVAQDGLQEVEVYQCRKAWRI